VAPSEGTHNFISLGTTKDPNSALHITASLYANVTTTDQNNISIILFQLYSLRTDMNWCLTFLGYINLFILVGARRRRDRMLVEFTTTYVISAFHL
jgi:hypothetical protein